MIVTAILNLISGLLDAMFSLLPDDTLGVFDNVLGTSGSNVDGMLQGIGAMGRNWPFASFLSWACGILETVLHILFPTVLAYQLANWIYKHIPQIGGFGPGSG